MKTVERKAWIPKSIKDESVSGFVKCVREALNNGQDFVVFEGLSYPLKKKLTEDVTKPKRLKLDLIIKTDEKNFWGNGQGKEVKLTEMEIENPDKGIFRVYFDTSDEKLGWDTEKHGLIYGDNVFLKDLNTHLQTLELKQPLEFTEENSQGKDFIQLKVKSDPEQFIKVFDTLIK